ncbi:MAG: iron-containing alcohol dehydrogenase family protein [Haloarculaceae archaeon]
MDADADVDAVADVAPTPLSFVTPETRFGAGVSEELPAVLDRRGIERPLVVTDAGIREAGILDDVVGGVAAPRFHDATTEPSTDDFADLPTAAVDGVVAVGGGSCLDTAKLVALLLAHGGQPADYLGVDHVPGPVAPLVAVPTTSGTGSQATQTAVVTHDGIKRGVSDEALRPDVALVDPALTEGLPPDLTARSGFDAFVHALESLTARDYGGVPPRPITYQGANPMSRPYSRRALALVHGALERAVEDDPAARRDASLGAHLAGVAFSNAGLGMVHALASTAGGLTGRPHGECLAASIEPGLRYNRPVREAAYATVADWLGVGDDATALLDECARLRDALGLPSSLRDLGLDPSDAETVVENTLVQDRRLATNPRDVDREALRAVVGDGLA